jgi:hypothetical protein
MVNSSESLLHILINILDYIFTPYLTTSRFVFFSKIAETSVASTHKNEQ